MQYWLFEIGFDFGPSLYLRKQYINSCKYHSKMVLSIFTLWKVDRTKIMNMV